MSSPRLADRLQRSNSSTFSSTSSHRSAALQAPAYRHRELNHWPQRRHALQQPVQAELRWIPELEELRGGIEEYRAMHPLCRPLHPKCRTDICTGKSKRRRRRGPCSSLYTLRFGKVITANRVWPEANFPDIRTRIMGRIRVGFGSSRQGTARRSPHTRAR